MRFKDITLSLEDYLEISSKKRVARSMDIAKELNVKRLTVMTVLRFALII